MSVRKDCYNSLNTPRQLGAPVFVHLYDISKLTHQWRDDASLYLTSSLTPSVSDLPPSARNNCAMSHIRVEWLASTSLMTGLSFCHLMAGEFHLHAPRSTCFALHNKKSSCLLLLLVYTSPDTIRRKINWSQVVVMLSRQKKLFTCSALRQHRPPPSSVYVSSFVPSKNVD